MNELNKQYENAKKLAMEFMQLGEIGDYLNALSEMNKFKKMMRVISYN